MANPKPSNPIKPGETRNPNGRPPKGYSITETIREMMASRPEIKQALGNKILEAALKGDLTATKLIWNYMDGLPIAKNEVKGTLSILDLLNDDEETTEGET